MATLIKVIEGYQVADQFGLITTYHADNYTHHEACKLDAMSAAIYYSQYPRAEVWKYKPAHLTA